MKPPELKRLAAKEKVPLGILEKDYVLTVVLAIIAELPLFNRMAFKGGTAIKKMYFPNARFSEDLDFTCFEDLSLPLLGVLQKTIGGKNISDVNFREITREEAPNRIWIKYEDFNGHPNSVRLDLSIGERPLFKSSLIKLPDDYGVGEALSCAYLHLSYYDMLRTRRDLWCEIRQLNFESKESCLNCDYFLSDPSVKHGEEVTSIFIRTMDLREILAEKIRALMDPKHNRPRDLYDIWFLLNNNVDVHVNLIEKKLALYGDVFGRDQFKDATSRIKDVWKRDLSPLLAQVPDFEPVETKVIKRLFPPS